ncbi:MAG: cysteine hydrolase [Deltaproteobacteria bacterium]|nr:cysteine hydrolase [Candidatus Zymogenaceae bacterium]
MTGNRYALLVIDMQKEYFREGGFLTVPEGPKLAENLLRLMDVARRRSVDVIHVRHISKNPQDATFRAGSDTVEFIDGFNPGPGEPVVTKTRPGSFYRTDLKDILTRRGIDGVIIGGLMSFMCCDTTAREAHARGYSVHFLGDATAAIDIGQTAAPTIHAVVCAVQGMVFSQVVTTEQMIDILQGETPAP